MKIPLSTPKIVNFYFSDFSLYKSWFSSAAFAGDILLHCACARARMHSKHLHIHAHSLQTAPSLHLRIDHGTHSLRLTLNSVDICKVIIQEIPVSLYISGFLCFVPVQCFDLIQQYSFFFTLLLPILFSGFLVQTYSRVLNASSSVLKLM